MSGHIKQEKTENRTSVLGHVVFYFSPTCTPPCAINRSVLFSTGVFDLRGECTHEGKEENKICLLITGGGHLNLESDHATDTLGLDGGLSFEFKNFGIIRRSFDFDLECGRFAARLGA